MRIGFIGLGKMGRPMCASLAAAGHELVVHDVRAEAIAEATSAHGARGAASAAAVAAQVEALLVSVPGPPEDEAVLLGATGVFAGAAPGLLVLDATTVGVEDSRRFAQRAVQHGVDYLDTPVSIIRPAGGTPTMTFMAGGPPTAFERARPILACIAPHVHLLGPTGSGTAAKLLNQVIYVTYMKVFGEALMLGERAGLALDPLLDVLGTSSAGIPNIVERYDGIRGRSNRKVAVNTVLSFLELANASFGDDFAAAPVCDASLAALRDVSRAGFGSEDLIGIGRKGC